MPQQPSPAATQVVSADLFQLLVESVMDYAIFVLDPEGHVQSWNEGARRIKGYQTEEIVGQHFSIFYPSEEIRRGKPFYALRVAADEGRWEEEGWRLRKDGSRFWASVVITALRDATGELVGFAKVTRDLTERRQAEEERRQLLALERAARAETEASLERLERIQQVTDAALSHLSLDELLNTLLDRISDALDVDTIAIFLLDERDGMLVPRAVRGIEDMVEQGVRIPFSNGYEGRDFSDGQSVLVDDVERLAVLNDTLRDMGIRSLMDVPLRVKNHVVGVLHVGTRFSRRFQESDHQLLRIVADRVALAVEHAQLFEAAASARFEADQSSARLQAQDEFLSIAAHELKTPMTGLKAATQLLLRRAKQPGRSLPPEFMRSFVTINEQTDKLVRLTEHLLDTARLRSGRLSIDRQITDVAALIRNVVARFQDQTIEHEFVATLPAAAWARVDALRLEQVLSNLLDNALKYGGGGDRIEIDLSQPHEGQIEFSVRDYGIGVPEEQRSRLFERYFQVSGQSRRGLGLGLYISRQIVEQHGGVITASFPEDGGSRFVVVLPTNTEDAEVAEDVPAWG